MAYLGKTPSQAVRSRYYFTASGGETSLAPAQVTGLSFTDANYVDVSLNGVALVSGTDYTATPSTNTISSLSALTASDVVEIVVYDTFSVFGGSVNGDFTISNGTLAAEAVTVTGLTTTGNIDLADSTGVSTGRVKFGNGDDLQMYFDGTNSVISSENTTDMYVQANNIYLRSSIPGAENGIVIAGDGAVTAYYDNAAKLATASFGAQVTGSLAVDTITNATASTDVTIDTNFDIILDAGGNVGIGTSGPTEDLHIKGKDGAHADVIIQAFTGYNSGLNFNDNAGMAGRIVYNHSNNFMEFDTNGSEAMRIDSSGNIGIGTSSPSATLDIVAPANTEPLKIKATTNSYNYITHKNAAGTDVAYTGLGGGAALTSGAVTDYAIRATANLLFGAGANTERMRIESGGDILFGKTVSGLDTPGMVFDNEGSNNFSLAITSSNDPVLYINRQSADGTLVQFRHANTSEGTISVSGTTVSYNGGHLSRWSQATDGNRIDGLVKGTVMTNLDQMAVWTKDGVTEDNEQLNCMAVSSVEGDANVAGVFVNWDDDDTDYTADMNVAMTGDMVIRIASGTTVARGDLLMSAGDGTAKPQGDDIVRSKTIAKVTSTTVSHTYDDGTYLVPCVLMAC